MWLRLTNQPEALGVPGFAFLTRREVTRSRVSASAGACRVGPFVSPPNTMLSGGRGPRLVAPHEARAAQPPTSSPRLAALEFHDQTG